VHAAASKLAAKRGKARGGVLLLVDEADALAQSRESSQMHHEDRAGVNAFIRGVDRLASAALPAAVIMCTNRLGALDPAVRRRAADVLIFERPAPEERRRVLSGALGPLGFSSAQLNRLVALTGPSDGRDYGCSYSDLIQRLLPSIVLDAFPSGPVTPSRAEQITHGFVPTPPFREQAA
jgi:AAA+ superfamily predicted ATPase